MISSLARRSFESSLRITRISSKHASPFTEFTSRSFATYKTSTGLVGLAVDPEGRDTLQKLAGEVLASVTKIPACAYRENVEQWFNFISKVTVEKTDIKAIEDEIDLGQIEEVIEFAKDELKVIDYYYEHKGWELVAEAKAEADKIVAEMEDSIYFSSPEARASYQQKQAEAAAAAAAAASEGAKA